MRVLADPLSEQVAGVEVRAQIVKRWSVTEKNA
jgi:hypothetical protein